MVRFLVGSVASAQTGRYQHDYLIAKQMYLMAVVFSRLNRATIDMHLFKEIQRCASGEIRDALEIVDLQINTEPDYGSIAKGAQAAPLKKARAAGSWLGAGTMARSTA